MKVPIIWLVILSAMVYSVPTSAQSETVLHSFQNGSGDGAQPWGTPLRDASGNLYGTTVFGGTLGWGAVFELSPPSSDGARSETILYSFAGGSDGSNPYAGLIQDGQGNLYGTTSYGGGTPQNYGTVFELAPPNSLGGSWTESVIYRFQGNPDGSVPVGGLVMDSAGNLYGTTYYGGSCGNGVIYELSPPATQGAAWTEAVLYSFKGCHGGYDSAASESTLIFGKDGALYATAGGGTHGWGTVFRLRPPSAGQNSWIEEVLYNFAGKYDGGGPYHSGVVFDERGNLYGTAFGGGLTGCPEGPGCGVVFQLHAPSVSTGTWKETVIHAFTGGTDGGNPFGGVTFDEAGNLFGTSRYAASTRCNVGFAHGCGALFKLSPSGNNWIFVTLHEFTSGSDGAVPTSNLVLDGSGIIYGVTAAGGAGGGGTCATFGPGCGTIFSITP